MGDIFKEVRERVSAEDAARLASVSRPTIYQWMQIPGFSVLRLGGCTRILVAAFQRWPEHRDADAARKYEQKKEENRVEILAHMETKKETVIKVVDRYLDALLERRKDYARKPGAVNNCRRGWMQVPRQKKNARPDAATSERARKISGNAFLSVRIITKCCSAVKRRKGGDSPGN